MLQKYEMFLLNLPSIDANIITEDKKELIFDPIRKRYVTLTPEEWVRQHFVAFLINHRGCPTSLIANEISIRLNDMNRRCDTVVYNRQLQPLAILEYKAPSVTVNKKVMQQACAYNNVLRVPYIIVSNGINHYCCHIDYDNMSYSFLNDIPSYNEMLPSDPSPQTDVQPSDTPS